VEFPLRDTLRKTRHRFVEVDGLKIFCREAGADTSPGLLLLHGFPTSSHMFRDLIPALAGEQHVVAPDLPGFGFSAAPDRAQFKYTFDHLTGVIDRFTTVAGLGRYAIYVFDYGAPVGFRLATRHPERIIAIISQNGNAYEEGLSEGWNPIQRYWKTPTAENRAALRNFLTPEATKWQYMHGVQDESLGARELYARLRAARAAGQRRDPAGPVSRLRQQCRAVPDVPRILPHEPAAAARGVGQERPVLPAGGAEAFKRDNRNAEVRFFDTGHFALETHASEIAAAIRDFLTRGCDALPGGRPAACH
jgi:pimeloyl-ACP methyl ester carboxylesterase